ncbi:hypothetical protein [Acinetobacter bereziniae]|uniref:hypothetical protein n=1 Tax=Acinetobacter bereziniae TaxID=106648 RepID=UPI00124FE4A1|nr:hypothetical protein [Acinetobacter bereziniae]
MPKNELTLESFVNDSNQTKLISNQNSKLELDGAINSSLRLITGIPLLNKSNKKADEFRQLLVNHVKEPEILKGISNAVGAPKPDETEDEFVKRSIDNIANFLLKSIK